MSLSQLKINFIVNYNNKIIFLPLNQIIFVLIDKGKEVVLFYFFMSGKNTKMPLEREREKYALCLGVVLVFEFWMRN
jgi:hypothetical protein